jgi:hypothetical protein
MVRLGMWWRMTLQPMALFDIHAPTFDISRLHMRETNKHTAAEWCGRYHYSGTPGGAGATYYGAFSPDLIAVVIIAQPTNVAGVAAKYGLENFSGNMEIARVAVHPDAPRNTASRVISLACKSHHTATHDEWLFSYADTGQGHHGGIYQALNSVYVGISPARPGYVMDGSPIHPRTLVSTFGTQAWPRVAELARERGSHLERVMDMNTAKHTYILPIGNKRSRQAIVKALQPYVKQYPKR